MKCGDSAVLDRLGVQYPDVHGRFALVTGSSHGIGKAVCLELVRQGAKVFGIAIDEDLDTVSEDYIPIRADLTDLDSLRKSISLLREQTESLDYLVNVAGIDPKYSIDEGDETRWQEIVDLNLRAYYFVIRGVLQLLRSGQGKSIVNVSSINYRLGLPRRSIYSISKAGILGLTTGLARELGAEGIRINSVSPGWVFTARQIEEYFTRPADRKKNLERMKRRQAINRRTTPQDVANHILFYLSEASAASTGHNCVVDAGWLLE